MERYKGSRIPFASFWILYPRLHSLMSICKHLSSDDAIRTCWHVFASFDTYILTILRFFGNAKVVDAGRGALHGDFTKLFSKQGIHNGRFPRRDIADQGRNLSDLHRCLLITSRISDGFAGNRFLEILLPQLAFDCQAVSLLHGKTPDFENACS